MTSSRTDDEGSVTVLTLACAVALILLMPLTGSVASAITVKHRLDAAADLAALAAAADVAVGDPCVTAARVAQANGGRLTDCRVDAPAVTVVVEPAVSVAAVPFRLASMSRAALE